MEKTNPLNDSIDKLREFQKKMDEAAGNTEDVKSGDCTKEDEQSEPGYILFNAITETSINILQMEPVVTLFKSLEGKLDETVLQNLIQALAIIMTDSAYTALVTYDELLKKELTKQFESIEKALGTIGADVTAHTSVLEVFRNKLNALEKNVKINEIKKEIGES